MLLKRYGYTSWNSGTVIMQRTCWGMAYCCNLYDWHLAPAIEVSFLNKDLSAFTWSGFGVLNWVPNAFLVPLLESSLERRVFTNHVPRLRLKWIRSRQWHKGTREQNSVPESGRAILWRKCQGYPNIKAIYRSLTYSLIASQITSFLWNRSVNFLFSDTQRGQLWGARDTLHFLTACTNSRDHVWRLSSASGWITRIHLLMTTSLYF